ncbi:MAG TPA: hypothetical protein DDY77_00330 [Clostridiales bacterium]|nr:hypothetical protein [Clostridiales bacterium]
MKSKLKLMLIGVLTFVLALSLVGFVGCASGGNSSDGGKSETIVTPPEKLAKVYSVTMSYNGEAVDGTITAELSLGEITVTANVRKDEAADGTVTFSSSVPEVAEIAQSGLITLKSKGETVITATAGDKKHEIVLTVTAKMQTGEKHVITVTDGEASVAEAAAGDVVTITPAIPEDKEFLEWDFSDNVTIVNGNEFVMPGGDVKIKARLVNKLASLTVMEQPLDNRVTFGSPLNKEGLKIYAKSVISGEEWDVTESCVISDFTDEDFVTATYTLGEVTKTAQIPVNFVAGYEVNAKSFKNPDNDDNVAMNPIPETLDGEFDEKYKESGYICGTQGQTLRFSMQNGTYSASNFDKNQSLYFYFYSDFKATARIRISAASTRTYRTDGASGTPDAVYETVLADKFKLYFNASNAEVGVNPSAKAEAFKLGWASWAVCGHSSESWLTDVVVEKGWNYLRIDSIDYETPNIAYIKVQFRNGDPVEFADGAKTELASALIMKELPEDLEKALKGYEQVGAALLEQGNDRTTNTLTIRPEGSSHSTACMVLGDKVTFYVYSEVDGVAKAYINTASGDVGSYINGTPNSVKEVILKNSFSVKLNGADLTLNDDAKAEAYSQDTASWSVCQHFAVTELATVTLKKGWNTMQFLYAQGGQANLGDLTFKFIYEE